MNCLVAPEQITSKNMTSWSQTGWLSISSSLWKTQLGNGKRYQLFQKINKFDSPNSARTLSSASSDMGPCGENDTLHALDRFFIFGILHFNVFLRWCQLSSFLKLYFNPQLKGWNTGQLIHRRVVGHWLPILAPTEATRVRSMRLSKNSLLKTKIMKKTKENLYGYRYI